MDADEPPLLDKDAMMFLMAASVLAKMIIPTDRELSIEEARVLATNVARVTTFLLRAHVGDR